MLISYNWLRELTGTALTPLELRERLTMVGLAIDAVEQSSSDSVLDVEVPSNRPDCLSHIGIAREVAVIERSRVSFPEVQLANTQGKAEDFTAVEIRDPDLCPRYSAWIVRGVTIGPSPEWLSQRLESIGQRPINNVTDITNLVLHEMGQPLHAFDLAQLAEQRIVVRRAEPGETVKTLDGVVRELHSEMLVIADAQRPVGVAGVMGGEESEISSSTRDVLIESAYFNPGSVRRTAHKLGLHTEASHRFERGADPEGVLRAQERCISLICEIAGGTATESAIDIYPAPRQARTVSFREARVQTLTGVSIESSEMQRILLMLGFMLVGPADTKRNLQDSTRAVNGKGAQIFSVPSWRVDVEWEEDLVEEIVRHTGYDKIATLVPPASTAGEYYPGEQRKRAVRRALAACGFDEAISFSFIDATHDGQFELIPEMGDGDVNRSVSLENPITEDWFRMRPTLLPGLLSAIRRNLNHGMRDITLFEIGRVFAANGKPGEMPHEREALALAATGAKTASGAGATAELDFFDLKGAIEAAVGAMNLPELEFEALAVRHLRQGQSAAIKNQGGVRIGTMGMLAEEIAGSYKFRQPVFVAEIDLSALLEQSDLPVLYSPLPRFPSVVRDVSLLLERKVTVDELLKAVAEQRVEDCRATQLVGVFSGQNIPAGKRSVTLRMEYRAGDRTLRDAEVDEMHWGIVKALEKKFAAEVR